MELRINEHVDVAFVKALSVLLLNKKKNIKNKNSKRLSTSVVQVTL